MHVYPVYKLILFILLIYWSLIRMSHLSNSQLTICDSKGVKWNFHMQDRKNKKERKWKENWRCLKSRTIINPPNPMTYCHMQERMTDIPSQAEDTVERSPAKPKTLTLVIWCLCSEIKIEINFSIFWIFFWWFKFLLVILLYCSLEKEKKETKR